MPGQEQLTPPSATQNSVGTLTAEDHLNRLLLKDVEEPWYRSFFKNIHDAIRPPKLPPLEVTSRPVAVKDIWGDYRYGKQAGVTSLIVHVSVIALLAIGVGANKQVREAVNKTVSQLIAPPIDLAPYQPKLAKQPQGGGGGGGDRSPLPASKGRLPKPSYRQFTPPVQVFNNPNPKLAMEPTILAPPDTKMPNVNMPNWGDPLAKIGPPSNGPGSGGGIGSGSGGGVGSGRGGGFGPGEGGGFGGGVFKVGGGVTGPQLVYKVEPEYSEEARKAKFQGTVVLSIVVDPSGHPSQLKVIRALGLGLDERAIEAVQKWRFRPGYKDGKPVAVYATVEVNFRLL